MTSNGDDAGLKAVESLYRDLMVDDEWAMFTERGFIWWGYRLAQHVEASEPFEFADGAFACIVRVWTDLVADVTETDNVYKTLDVVNMQQSMSALVWDPAEGTIVESFTSIVFDDTVQGWAGPMATAAVLQNAAAHSRAHSVAELVGGQPWASDHPTSGRREEMDDMLNAPAQAIAPLGREPSAFAGRLVAGLDASGEQIGVTGDGDSSGYTVEVVYSSDVPVAMAMAGGDEPGTALVQVWTDQPHPELGSGALLTLRLPISVEDDQASVVAGELNRLEAAGESATTAMGAWCRNPSDPNGLAFVTFIPSSLARPGVLENLLAYNAGRSIWAHQVLGS